MTLSAPATTQRQKAFDAFERYAEAPMLLLALAMVPLLVAPLVLNLTARVESTLLALDWIIWALFAIELIVKTALAQSRLRYLRDHWLDVVIVVIPFLRPLRVVRSARALRLLRLVRLASFATRTTITTRAVLRSHGIQYVMLFGVLFMLVAAAIVTIAERQGSGTITDLQTGLWWAITTITTVGYGDTFPVTAAGRGVGVLLMLVGIGTFGMLTAGVAAFFVQASAEEVTNEKLLDEIRRLHRRIDELESN